MNKRLKRNSITCSWCLLRCTFFLHCLPILGLKSRLRHPTGPANWPRFAKVNMKTAVFLKMVFAWAMFMKIDRMGSWVNFKWTLQRPIHLWYMFLTNFPLKVRICGAGLLNTSFKAMKNPTEPVKIITETNNFE